MYPCCSPLPHSLPIPPSLLLTVFWFWFLIILQNHITFIEASMNFVYRISELSAMSAKLAAQLVIVDQKQNSQACLISRKS